jgi:hypothetical protein
MVAFQVEQHRWLHFLLANEVFRVRDMGRDLGTVKKVSLNVASYILRILHSGLESMAVFSYFLIESLSHF